ncbi:MAG: NAD(P)H-binding protein [Candidatus Acidiferrales bacterium]
MILITGASGHIGRRVSELLAQQNARLRLMSRTPEKTCKLADVETVPGDFQDGASLARAFADIEKALVISGKAEPGERARLHNNAFRAAAKAGVKQIVYLSLRGASPDSVYPYCRDHYDSEQFLAACGVPYTSVRGAFYMDMLFAKFDSQGVVRGPAGDGRGAFISREDTARAAAAAILARPAGVIEVTGRELLTLDDVSCRLSAITGRALRYENESADEMAKRLSRTSMPKWAQAAEVAWFQAIAAGEQTPVTHGYQRLTAIEPLNIEQYCSIFPNVVNGLRTAA